VPTEKQTIERILSALSELTGNGYIKKTSFMDDCKISERTFNRFIAELKYYISVKYDPCKNLYVIDRTKEAQRTEMLEYYKKLIIKDEFLFFYAFVRSMIYSKYFFPPFSTDQGASTQPKEFSKVLGMLEDLVGHQNKKIYDKIEYYISGHYDLGKTTHYKDVFSTIINSFQTETVMQFNYYRNIVKVEPLKMVYYNGKWYLIALLLESSKGAEEECNVVRNYKISQIKKSKLMTNEFFSYHENIEISFQNSFGIYMDEDIKRAVINIYGTAADEAMEIVWHQAQVTRKVKDKDGNEFAQIMLEYPERGSVELISRALSFGTNAEIVSPPELRKQWQNEIKAMSEKYLK